MTVYSSMIKCLEILSPMEVVVLRGALQIVVMGSLIYRRGGSFKSKTDPTHSIILALVLLTGGLRLIFIFAAFARLPVGRDGHVRLFLFRSFIVRKRPISFVQKIIVYFQSISFFFSLIKCSVKSFVQ